MQEKEIEKILVAEVKKLGGRAYKWMSPGNDGVPDRIVVFPNRTPIFVELKADNGKLSALQKVQIDRLKILKAVDDYRIALRMLKKKPRDSGARGMKMSVERFFRSDWFALLTGIDGEMLIWKLREEVK